MLFIKGEKKRVHFINLKETKGEKNCSKAQMLIDFASQKKSVRCIEKTSAGVGKFCEWHSRYNFLLDERVCSSRELLHVMQIASNLFRNNFWGKRKKIEQRRNNKSEDVFTDNLKRVCNHWWKRWMETETNTEKETDVFFCWITNRLSNSFSRILFLFFSRRIEGLRVSDR